MIALPSSHLFRIGALLLTVLFLNACGLSSDKQNISTAKNTSIPQTATVIAATPTTTPSIDENMLKNLSYTLSFTDNASIPLKNGEYENLEEKIHTTYIRSVFGDLNNDQKVDAAVLLATDFGASGMFTDLIAVINDNGQLKPLNSVFIGDRIDIKSFEVKNGAINVKMVTQGPDDPMCCPTLEVEQSYHIANDALLLANTNHLTYEVMANAAYPYEQQVINLSSGKTELPIVPDSATKLKVSLAAVSFGDLTNDNTTDAAVILAVDPGGSGTFYYLHVVTLVDGKPVSIANELLGDRVKINQFGIENGNIMVSLTMHGPNDPMCCPSKNVNRVYELSGNKIIVVSEK